MRTSRKMKRVNKSKAPNGNPQKYKKKSRERVVQSSRSKRKSEAHNANPEKFKKKSGERVVQSTRSKPIGATEAPKVPTPLPCDPLSDVTACIPASSATVVHRGRKRKISDSVHSNFLSVMGPHLRYLTATLIMHENEFSSDILSPEVMKRFHPNLANRAVERCVTHVNKDCKDGEGTDWNELAKSVFGTGRSLSKSRSSGKPKTCTKQKIETKLSESVTIVTSVGTAALDVDGYLDLYDVAKACVNVQYRNVGNEFIVELRLSEPSCTAVLQETGIIYLVGAKSLKELRDGAEHIVMQIHNAGFPVKLDFVQCVKMQYFTGCWQLPFHVNLEAIMKHEMFSKIAYFDANLFPGVIFKTKGSPILTLVLQFGMVIMTEAKSEKEMQTTMEKIYPFLRLFEVQS